MQILASSLKNLPAKQPAYLIHGGEILQTTESIDAVRALVKTEGFLERQAFLVKPNFNWQQLTDAALELSLFSEKLLIELHVGDDKLGTTGSKAIVDFLARANSNLCLMVVANKLDSQNQKSKWFTAIQQAGCVIVAKPIAAEQFNAWLIGRLRQHNFTANSEVLALLARLYYGNLIAAAQLIEKLAICLPSGAIQLADLTPHLHNNADFNVFNLIDAGLNRQTQKICTIFSRLQQEHIEPIIILWALARELRTLMKIAFALEHGGLLHDICKAERIWAARANTIQYYLGKTCLSKLANILQQLTAIDLAIKGIEPGLIWEPLQKVYLEFAAN